MSKSTTVLTKEKQIRIPFENQNFRMIFFGANINVLALTYHPIFSSFGFLVFWSL